MSYSPSSRWSEEEDNVVRVFYARHGKKWVGWSEVLPHRTPRAISARASLLGVKWSSRQEKKKAGGDRKATRRRVVRNQDPYETYVMACMDAGLTPTQIDLQKHWRVGTSIQILTEKWRRENEQKS